MLTLICSSCHNRSVAGDVQTQGGSFENKISAWSAGLVMCLIAALLIALGLLFLDFLHSDPKRSGKVRWLPLSPLYSVAQLERMR